MKEINDKLTQEELYVLKDKGTERPFSGEFDTFLRMAYTNAKIVKLSYSNLIQNMMRAVVGQVFLKQLMKKQ